MPDCYDRPPARCSSTDCTSSDADVEMVPLFERCAHKLVEYWKEGLDADGTAVKPIIDDLNRMVWVICLSSPS